MKFKELLEVIELFPSLEKVEFDPDRDGPYDVARHMLPILVKIAYANLWHKKAQHEKKHGPKSDEPDAYNFNFSHKDLEDELEDLINHVSDSFKNLRSDEITAAIKKASKDFKDPLEKE